MNFDWTSEGYEVDAALKKWSQSTHNEVKPMSIPSFVQGYIDQGQQYVQANYGGDAHAAFLHYADPNTGKIDKAGIMDFLKDAGIGYRFERSFFANAVLDEVDTDHDGWISWDEALAAQLLAK